MWEYDIYLPTTGNVESAVGESPLDQILKSLTDAFGGCTHFTSHHDGARQIAAVTFHGDVNVIRVLDDGSAKFDMAHFKRNLEQWLGQQSVLIVARSIRII